MGVVWSVTHRATGSPYAIKIATPTQHGMFLQTFRREAKVMASLDHDAIVRIFDQGVLSDEDIAVYPSLRRDSAWLLMERCDGGTLRGFQARLPFVQLRAVLRRILQGLAHAHARHLVHLDLKPSNVLLPFEGGLEHVRLADFGLAHAFDRRLGRSSETKLAGTPAYMAPEQIQSAWRDVGPRTDLYALGCLAWAMAVGKTPFFDRGAVPAMLFAHVHRSPADFDPKTPCPPGFEQWIRCLMAKDPMNRPRSAASAIRMLDSLDASPKSLRPFQSVSPSPLAATVSIQWPTAKQHALETTTDGAPIDWRGASTDLSGPGRPVTDEFVTDEQMLPVKATWSTQPDGWREAMPPGMGRGLLSVRRTPLAGRRAVQDRLWTDVLASAKGERKMVLLDGAHGEGAEAFALWLGDSLREQDCALVVTLTPSDPDGLVGVVRRLLRCDGLDADAALRRLVRQLPDAAGSPALLLLAQAFAGSELSDTEWNAALAKWLAIELARGPVVLIGVGTAASQTLTKLFSTLDRTVPALLVLAEVGDTRLTPDRIETLAPLDRQTAGRLARRLLGLDSDSVAVAVEQSAARPLLLVHLLTAWVEGGYLVAGADGLCLNGSPPETLLDELGSWVPLVLRALGALPVANRETLRTAALLGMHPNTQELSILLRERGSSLEPIERWLLDHELLTEKDGERDDPSAWTLVHPIVRDLLSADATREERQKVANIIEQVGAPDWEERAGVLLAGIDERAGRLLLAAAQRRESLDQFDQAERLLSQWQELGRRPESERVDALLQELRLHRIRGRSARAFACLAELMTLKRERAQEVRLLHLRGRLCRLEGRLQDAVSLYSAALSLATTASLRSNIAKDLGDLLVVEGRLDEAEKYLDQSLAEVGDDPVLLATIYLGRSHLERARGSLDVAARQVELGLQALGKEQRQSRSGALLYELAEIRRGLGEWSEAERLYTEAAELFELAGASLVACALLGRAQVLLEQGNTGQAGPVLERCRRSFRRNGQLLFLAATNLGLLTVYAEARDWGQWDATFAELLTTFDRGDMSDDDLSRLALLAYDAALDAEEEHRSGLIASLEEKQPTLLRNN